MEIKEFEKRTGYFPTTEEYKTIEKFYMNFDGDKDERRNRKIKKDLEREQEWKPYNDAENVSQCDYDKLAKAAGTKELTDDEAKSLLYEWYGFAKEKITIHRTTPIYEVNRHGRLRKIGETNRSPIYNATDWNYIRFDCGCMSYELQDDNLRPFYQ